MKNFAVKNIILGLCGILLLVMIGGLGYFKPGQTESAMLAAPETAPADVERSPESEIRGILEQYYEIARRGDRNALKKFSEEISLPEYRYSSELGVMDKAAAIRYFETLDLQFVTAGFETLTVQVYGTTTAIAKYRDISTVKINGSVTKRPVQFTNVWINQNGMWKIAAEHSSIAEPRELMPRNRFADKLAGK